LCGTAVTFVTARRDVLRQQLTLAQRTMESERPLLCSREPSTRLHHKQVQSTPHPHVICVKKHLLFSYHLFPSHPPLLAVLRLKLCTHISTPLRIRRFEHTIYRSTNRSCRVATSNLCPETVNSTEVLGAISHLSTSRNKQTPWPESASELYRPSDRRLLAK
jgi:hypothetical protein